MYRLGELQRRKLAKASRRMYKYPENKVIGSFFSGCFFVLVSTYVDLPACCNFESNFKINNSNKNNKQEQ